MTIADVYLAAVAGQAIFAPEEIMNRQSRDKEIPNLTRYVTLMFPMFGKNYTSMLQKMKSNARADSP